MQEVCFWRPTAYIFYPMGWWRRRYRCAGQIFTRRYLVDPASSHMLVSKIKPCMSQYIPLQGETANGSLDQLWFLRSYNPTWITVVILELIHATKLRPQGKSAFIRSKPIGLYRPSFWWLWITLSWSHGLEPATYLSNVCPINFRWYVICLPWL